MQQRTALIRFATLADATKSSALHKKDDNIITILTVKGVTNKLVQATPATTKVIIDMIPIETKVATMMTNIEKEEDLDRATEVITKSDLAHVKGTMTAEANHIPTPEANIKNKMISIGKEEETPQ